jgi:hypothetical protein
VKGPLGRYGGPSLRPLVGSAAAAGALVAVCSLVLFGLFGGSDDTTPRTALPSLSDNDVPPPPTVALLTPTETTGVVTPTVTPTPSPGPLLATASPTPSTVSPSASRTVTSQRAGLPTPTQSYHNCAQVRAAGKAPLHRGDPGYSRKLDKNGDGVACDHGNS